jgi:hypothetical protein
MAEWLYEAGIGEDRAALIEDGQIIEVLIEAEHVGPRAGAVVSGRLRADRIVALDSGEEVLLDFAPPRLPEGAAIHVIVTREALSERGKPKRAKARAVAMDHPLSDAPSLLERIGAHDVPIRTLNLHDPDRFEEAGWTEILESAANGDVRFADGVLRISLTPAMTLIDVDGQGPATALAMGGAEAAAATIRLFDIGGSIGLDLPTLQGKADRLAVAEAFDLCLPQPFERTAVNGFGFLQIIRPRRRASLCETLQMEPPAAAARALLRRAQRAGVTGAVTLVATPVVVRMIAGRPDWLNRLSLDLGGAVALREDPGLGIGGGYVERTVKA